MDKYMVIEFNEHNVEFFSNLTTLSEYITSLTDEFDNDESAIDNFIENEIHIYRYDTKKGYIKIENYTVETHILFMED